MGLENNFRREREGRNRMSLVLNIIFYFLKTKRPETNMSKLITEMWVVNTCVCYFLYFSGNLKHFIIYH